MVTFMQKGHDPVKFDQVVVEDADEVLVLVKVFANEDEAAATPRLKRELDALDADYDQLLARHVQLHRELFERVSLNISTGGDATSNEQTLLHAYDGE